MSEQSHVKFVEFCTLECARCHKREVVDAITASTFVHMHALCKPKVAAKKIGDLSPDEFVTLLQKALGADTGIKMKGLTKAAEPEMTGAAFEEMMKQIDTDLKDLY